MKITLNLATRPYIELRPIYARLRLMMLVLAVLALPMLLVLRVEQVKARESLARVDQLKHNIALLQAQQRAARALMQQPENAGVLAQADFLNELFRRKAFSWTATMSDLETTLPAGVQVLSIDPVVAPDGHVTIRMRVSGARERAVDVVRNLEHSRHFIAPRLASEALANQNSGSGSSSARMVDTASASTDVAFDILADYRPLPHSHDRAGLPAGKGVLPGGAAEASAPEGAEVQSAQPAPQGRARHNPTSQTRDVGHPRPQGAR
jgi:type IV pilus assembly protein PilN